MVRFPFTLLSALVGAGVLIALIEYEMEPVHHLLEKWAAISALGLPLFTALAAFAERRNFPRTRNILIQAIGVLILALLFLSTPENITRPLIYPMRFLLSAIAFHFLASFLPFLGKGNGQGFWLYNKALFLRFLTAALYSAVLYAGLAIALGAVKTLFDLDIESETFFQLWVIVGVIFQTVIFLSGFPEDLPALTDEGEYPRGLKIFVQYVLLPLVGIYLVILYAYGLKILFQWNWPQGWVSQLVLWYSVVSILSILLLWPLREKADSGWIKSFTSWFFRLLIPLLVMLFLAIFERIGDYGVTVNRYLVIGMAVGLSVVVLYFTFSRRKDIRLIPVVVFCLAVLASYGPLSAFSFAERSQLNRLDARLRSNDLVVEGKSAETIAVLPEEERRELSSMVDYLLQWHGIDLFDRWFDEAALAAIPNRDDRPNDDLAKMFGFDYMGNYGGYWDTDWKSRWFNYSFSHQVLPLAEYDYLIALRFEWSEDQIQSEVHLMGEDSMRILMNRTLAEFAIEPTTERLISERLTFDLTDSLASRMRENEEQQPLPDTLNVLAENDYLRGMLICQAVSGNAGGDSATISVFSGLMLLKRK